MIDAKELEQILPHRYPFLLVDKIVELEPGKRACGRKNVTINEQYFRGHFPGHPVMPGVLIVEALAQVGAVALLKKPEFAGKIPLFAGIDQVRFKRQVVPGDVLELEVELHKLKGSIGKGTGRATVNGENVCQAELLFAIQDNLV